MPWDVSEVERALRGAEYPATGEQLADVARRNGADENLVAELRGIIREVDAPVNAPTGVMRDLKGRLGGG